ncbi:GNAT family N-acetyltransferase [Natronomonas sp. EA1]|uniref:GNAT family N-acetyltransferase n=1 Tax=Natronomonas sp. EA1 TaxID=3421655 RepID=UPI003EBCD04D
MELRPLSDDELFVRYIRYAFRPQDGPDLPDDWQESMDPPIEEFGLYGADEAPVSVCSYYTFDTQLRGVRFDVSGISTVATPPEHRRQGYVAEMLRQLVDATRDTHPISALWPFEYPFYRKYGWAQCSTYVEWTAPPAALHAAASDGSGAFRRVEADDWALLDAVHERAVADTALGVSHTEDWWRERVFRGWREDPYVYVYEEDGEPRAYLSYSVLGDEERTLQVRTHAATEGYVGQLLGFLANHDSQVAQVRFTTAREFDLLARVEDPRELTCEVKPGPMVRLEDVPRTLDAIDYAADGSVTVTLSDPLFDREDTYSLVVADGHATCEPTAEPPDATLELGAFSQLVVGHREAATLADADELDADPATVKTLGALFPGTGPYLREGF